MKTLEKELQRYAETLCKLYHLPACHIPNCITRQVGGKWQSFIVNTGNQGWPDIIVIGPSGRVLFMELKTLNGKLRPEQERFKAYCDANGHAYTVCRTREEIEQALKALSGG